MNTTEGKIVHLIDENGEKGEAATLLRDSGYQVKVSTSTSSFLKSINENLIEYITNQDDFNCSEHQKHFSTLTKRERQVVEHLVLGEGESSNKAIAKVLNISHRTVEEHRASAMRKMKSNSLKELITIVITCNLFNISLD